MKRAQFAAPESLKETLVELPSIERVDLLAYWEELYKTKPPAHISTKLLRHAIAYKLQERHYGGLSPTTKRFLHQVVRDTAIGKPISAKNTLKAGTRLVRKWHGTVYEVVVLPDGVLLDGEKLSSLSEAATKITGVKWSGPRFFGLKKGGR